MTKNMRSETQKTATAEPILNSEWIRVLMTYRKITAAEIGQRVGLDEATVRKVINNLEPTSVDAKRAILRALSRALRRKMDTLCVGKRVAA